MSGPLSCGCPGLFAGQYDGLEDLPSMYVERRYQGAAGFLGLAKAYPTDAAHDYISAAP
jgi:hypothetical protein